ncbi:MAG TPA: hypothetical protein VFF54_05115 [Thermodesulfobacteriota bacterium]|nr:hypothetical protein [Thermodesulfobacteriota bacterium]
MEDITIDINKVKDIAHRGIRRTSAFMGLGVNAARDEQFKKYQLSDSAFSIISDKLDDKSIAHIKEEFEKWVISNGLTEIVESFCLFLDEVHRSCLLMATNKERIVSNDARKFGINFKKVGVEDKLKTLKNRFSVTSDKEKYLGSINQARNCITHRKGMVGTEDLRGEESFRLIWWAVDICIETPNGEKYTIPEGGLLLQDGGSLRVHFKERIIEYKLGDIVNLSPKELSEICFLVYSATHDIARSVDEYAKKIGVNIVVTEVIK